MVKIYKALVIMVMLIIISVSYISIRSKQKLPDTTAVEPFSLSSMNCMIDNNMVKIISSGKEMEPVTLEGMKKKYGKIDVITLFNGRVINGIIKSRGDVYSILTTDGIINVQVGKIMNTKVKL